MKRHTKPKIINAFRPGFVEIISLPSKGVIRGVFSANHLTSNDILASNNQETEHIKTQTNVNTKSVPINNKITLKTPMLTEKTGLGNKKGIRPVKNWVLVCWCLRFDWSLRVL